MEEGIDLGMMAGMIVIEERGIGTGTETTATVNGAATVIATVIVINLENETTTEMPTETEMEIGTDRLRQTLDVHLPHLAAQSPKQKNFHSTRNPPTPRL